MAVVCCTECATKFEHTDPKKSFGDFVEVVCPDGHKSMDVLTKQATLDSNELPVAEPGMDSAYYSSYHNVPGTGQTIDFGADRSKSSDDDNGEEELATV